VGPDGGKEGRLIEDGWAEGSASNTFFDLLFLAGDAEQILFWVAEEGRFIEHGFIS